MRKKIGLVLGGGSALGFAHVGVLKVLQKYNIPIDIVVGTSMGGVVGAAYVTGVSTEDMTKFAIKFRKSHFFDINFDGSGVFSGNGIMKSINKFLPDQNIEDLPIKFACVACDLIEEKEYDFVSGSIRDAVRSTLSIPGILVPFKKDGKALVDGGVKNNLPVDLAKKMGADIVIACDVLKFCKLNRSPKNIMQSLLATINSMTKDMQRNQANKADLVITPDLTGLTQLDFNKKSVYKIILIGEEETEKQISKIKDLIATK